MTIARLMPRVRTAGSPKIRPSGIAAATPATQPEQERDVVHRDQTAGDVRAEAGDRVLSEGELAGVSGEHDDRQQDDRHAQRHGDGVDPLRLFGHHHEHDGAAAEQRPRPVDPAVADHRQLLQEVVAQREGATPDHEDHDDHQEGEGGAEAFLIGVPSDQCLPDADRESGRGGDRERPEVADQRGGERREDERGHRRDLQGDDRARRGSRRRRRSPTPAPSSTARSDWETSRSPTPSARSRTPLRWRDRTGSTGTAATDRVPRRSRWRAG